MSMKQKHLTKRIAMTMILALSFQNVGVLESARAEAGSTPEANAPSCTLPVCDIDARIEELKSLAQDARFKAAKDLRAQYKKSRDSVAWENLLVFGEKLAELSRSMQDDDWVLNEALGLADDAVLALLKFRQPVEVQYLMPLFKKLSGEGGRYSAIMAWSDLVPKLEDRDTLSELLKFGSEAQKYSISIEDPEWIAQAAGRLASLATARLVAMDPAHEGVYEIQSQCTGPRCANYPRMKNMIVMETTTSSGGQGLVITFPMEFGGTPAYSFYSAAFRDGPEQVVASSSAAGPASPRPAELKVLFSRATGEVRGLLRDTRSTTSWKFTGKPIYRVLSTQTQTTRGETPKPEEVPGIYEVELGNLKSQLVIRQTMDRTFYASLVNSSYTLDFKIGQYIPAKSFLSLIYVGTNQNIVKVALKLEKSNGVITATGFSYTSRNPIISTWKAKRIAPLEDDELF